MSAFAFHDIAFDVDPISAEVVVVQGVVPQNPTPSPFLEAGHQTHEHYINPHCHSLKGSNTTE